MDKSRSKIQKQGVLFVQKVKEAEVPGYFGRPLALCRAAPFAGESKVWERVGQGSDHASEVLALVLCIPRESIK